MDFTWLSHLNAALNGLCALLLTAGWWAIRSGRRTLHRGFMLAACSTSALFLVSYLVYHYQVGSVRFQGTGAIRTFYLGLLLTHTVLAALIVPLVIWVLVAALRQRFERHRAWARVTLPLWLYVSVTGVAIYWMLYHGGFS